MMIRILCFFLMMNIAHAVMPDERLADPALEARARVISQELRCMVCQNQSIDDSDATIAKDLRILVRERLTLGESNGQVIAYIHARYGDFILLRPPFNAATYLLWFAPFFILLIAAFFLVQSFKNSNNEE